MTTVAEATRDTAIPPEQWPPEADDDSSQLEDGELVELEDVHGNKFTVSVGALAQNATTASSPELLYGDLRIDGRSREVSISDRPIMLTRREFDLLHFMAQYPRQVFSKARLLEAVWSSDATWQSEATVTEHVRRLRQKLGYSKSSGHGFTTVWGVGYRFEP